MMSEFTDPQPRRLIVRGLAPPKRSPCKYHLPRNKLLDDIRKLERELNAKKKDRNS